MQWRAPCRPLSIRAGEWLCRVTATTYLRDHSARICALMTRLRQCGSPLQEGQDVVPPPAQSKPRLPEDGWQTSQVSMKTSSLALRWSPFLPCSLGKRWFTQFYKGLPGSSTRRTWPSQCRRGIKLGARGSDMWCTDGLFLRPFDVLHLKDRDLDPSWCHAVDSFFGQQPQQQPALCPPSGAPSHSR